jgi:integrase
LQWGDCQLKGKSPHLRIVRAVAKGIVGTPKNGKERTVYLTPKTVEVLEAARHLKGDLVFCDDKGEEIHSNSSEWGLRYACQLAGLRAIGWHVLRHMYASHLAMRGVSLQTIQQQLGHSGVAMTLRYAHLSPGSVSGAVAVLDAVEEVEKGPQMGHGSEVAC